MNDSLASQAHGENAAPSGQECSPCSRVAEGIKVLFLDVDGVLNTRPGSLDGDKLDLLAGVCRQTGAGVVVSSTWRHHPHLMDRLRPELERRGIAVLGQTVDSAYRDPGALLYRATTRANEIQDWLNEHREVQRWAILDDAPFQALKGWLVQTDSLVGLTAENAAELVARLGVAAEPQAVSAPALN